MSKTIKPGTKIQRFFQLDRAAVNVEMRTAGLAFSSESPVERWWGIEILDHASTSVRLGRISSAGPLLMDHDPTEQVGVIESVEIGQDRIGRAVVRFGRGAEADEIFQDVVDGIRRNVSVGYVVHKATLVETGQDGPDQYRVTDWEPYEISLVSVPADTTVGVGRSSEADNPIIQSPAIRTEKAAMTELNPQEIEARGVQAERKRADDIRAIGAQFTRYDGPKLASEYVASGHTVEEFRQAMLDKVSTAPQPTADIGMSDKEKRQYSFLRVLNALANPNDRKAREAAGFEFEASRAVADKMGRAPQGVFVPQEVLRRDLTVGTATAGGHTVATNLLAQDFIEMLRNAMVLDRLGIRVLSGLVGNIAIPRQAGGATAYWVSESGAPTESQQAFDQVAMSPKTVGAFTDISRKLLLQSSIDVESFVRQDLATVLGLEIERVAINGSGTAPEPRGILNTSGIGDVAGGTNGLAPAWAHIVELETDVAVANAAIGNMAYLTNAKVRGKLKTTEQFATSNGQPVWQNGNTPLNGYKSEVTNAVPSNLTKGTSSGVCSAAIFGNFADLLIGLWGSLDLTVDPYSNSTSGTVRIVALQDVDVAVRHAESFSAMKDALTV